MPSLVEIQWLVFHLCWQNLFLKITAVKYNGLCNFLGSECLVSHRNVTWTYRNLHNCVCGRPTCLKLSKWWLSLGSRVLNLQLYVLDLKILSLDLEANLESWSWSWSWDPRILNLKPPILVLIVILTISVLLQDCWHHVTVELTSRQQNVFILAHNSTALCINRFTAADHLNGSQIYMRAAPTPSALDTPVTLTFDLWPQDQGMPSDWVYVYQVWCC